MKARTVKLILSKHFAAWVNSLPEGMRSDAKKFGVISGGSIVSLLLNEEPKDFDIYFTDFEFTKKLAQHYVSLFEGQNPRTNGKTALSVKSDPKANRVAIVAQSSGVASEEEPQESYEYFEGTSGEEAARYLDDTLSSLGESNLLGEKPGKNGRPKKYSPVLLTANAITLSGGIQLILRFIGPIVEVRKCFDFVHCTCYWEAASDHLELPPKALEAILTKELRYLGGSKYPLCSIIRIRKFIERGWTITAGQVVKAIWDVNKLNLSDPDVLQEQLTGVDAAYFTEVLSILRDGMKTSGAKQIDGTYLMELIDRVL